MFAHTPLGIDRLLDLLVAGGTISLAIAAFKQIGNASAERERERERSREHLHMRAQTLRQMLRALPGPDESDRPEGRQYAVLWSRDDLRALENSGAEVGGELLSEVRRATTALRGLLALIDAAIKVAPGPDRGTIPWSHVPWTDPTDQDRWPEYHRSAERALTRIVDATE